MQSTIDSTALYMHSLDGFESSTSEFRAKTGPNEPSRPARNTILERQDVDPTLN